MVLRIATQLKFVLACAMLSLAVINNASATVIFEDDFDNNDFHSIWTVTAGNVDVGNYADLCNNDGGASGFCVDTEGTGAGSNGSFQLTNPLSSLVAGDYTFSFDYGNNAGFGNNGDNILNWLISSDQGTLASGSVNSGGAADYMYDDYSLAFSLIAPATNAVILFDQVGAENNWGGTVLDNVSFELVNAHAVPAPATLMLFALGLIGLSRRRR